jgi:hypothetical protein
LVAQRRMAKWRLGQLAQWLAQWRLAQLVAQLVSAA